jgi:hypothetical protein
LIATKNILFAGGPRMTASFDISQFGDLEMNRFAVLLTMAMVFAIAQSAVGTVIVQNSGFEEPSLVWNSATCSSVDGNYYSSMGAYYNTAVKEGYSPLVVPGWTFGPTSTIDNTEVGILSAKGVADWGQHANETQCATFASAGGGWISQELAGFVAGTASVSFYAEAYASTDTLSVTLDGTLLKFGDSSVVQPAINSMGLFTSNSFAVTGGTHTLMITASRCGNVDDVSVMNGAVPEPGTICMLIAGILAMLGYAWRKRK